MEYVDTAQIARMFGVQPKTVRDSWVHRPGFPKPAYAPTPKTRRWRADEVRQWATKGEKR